MLDFQQKWKAKTLVYSRGVQIFLLIIAVYGIFSVYRVYEKKKESDRELVKMEQQLIALSSKDTALTKQIDMLQTDQGLEAEIRAKYTVALENEKVVILVEDNVSEVATTTRQQSLFKRIKNFFGL